MEKKTIGGFIATLRKANGMTQKDLAEKLNVSDKTISRWERDDGAPDLSLIPVIAEVFGVTCDELLRGERKPISERRESPEENEPTSKGEKQRQRILTLSLTKYKTRSFIAIGIAITGLIAAMIGNFGFLRAYIGFLVGVIFYLASVICQAIFVNNTFLSVADDSISAEENGRFKKSVIYLAEQVIGLNVVLLGFSLPLVLFSIDTYAGLAATSWFGAGIIGGIIALLLYCVVCYFMNAALLKNGTYYFGERESQVYHHNHKLKRKCSVALLVIMGITFIIQMIVMSGWDVYAIAGGTQFHDYESFVTYMEQDIPYTFYQGDTVMIAEPVGEVIYYDEHGNEVSEEEALRRTLVVADGTEEGKVVCEYIARNEEVASVRYSEENGSLLPITVITYDDLRRGQARKSVLNTMFGMIYCVEAAGVLAAYFGKRKKG